MCFIAKEKLDEYNKYDEELKIYEGKAKKKNGFFFLHLCFICFFFGKYESLDTFSFTFVQFVIYVCKHIIIEEGHDNWWVWKG